MRSEIRRARRVARLVYLTGRAVCHTIFALGPIGEYCVGCNSFMTRRPDSTVVITAVRPCPVHVALRELARIDLPNARARS